MHGLVIRLNPKIATKLKPPTKVLASRALPLRIHPPRNATCANGNSIVVPRHGGASLSSRVVARSSDSRDSAKRHIAFAISSGDAVHLRNLRSNTDRTFTDASSSGLQQLCRILGATGGMLQYTLSRGPGPNSPPQDSPFGHN